MAMTAKLTHKVTVRKSNSSSAKAVTTFKVGTKVTVTTTKADSKGNVWGKCSKGWFMMSKKNGKKTTKYCKITGDTGGSSSLSDTGKKIQLTNAKKQYISLAKSLESTTNNGHKLNKCMQLHGLPYQFLPSVDYRVNSVSNLIGRKYIEKIILNAPVVTIMPGKPSYLPGQKNKASITQAFIEAASGNLGPLQTLSTAQNIDNIKFYDFKTAYVECMQYVNVMCRATAAFLELEGDSDNPNSVNYKINGTVANFMNYDWKDYRWNGRPYRSSASSVAGAAAKSAAKATKSTFDKLLTLGSAGINYLTKSNNAKASYTEVTGKDKKGKNKTKTQKVSKNTLNLNDNTSGMSTEETDTFESLFRNVHYMQFYVDPTSDVSESISNSTKESSLKSTFNNFSDTVKDIAFMANSGGVDTEGLQKLGSSFMDKLGSVLSNGAGSVNESAGSLVSRLMSTGKNVLKGDNVIMPDIYSNSEYSKSYNIIIPLKALYGNKFSIYMDVLVPMCFALGLVLPKATSANTFSSPMLVKCFMPGKFTCNMGIVTSCSIERSENRNVDGLCQEMTITLGITDLYSDLTMTPASDPVLFCNNSSLVEYLAINCGLDLVDSQFTTKASLLWNNLKNSVRDIPDNVASKVGEELDDMIYKFTGL